MTSRTHSSRMFNLNVTVEFAASSDVVEIAELSRKYIEYDLGWHYTPKTVKELLKDSEKNVVVARMDKKLAGFGIMTYADQNANLDLLAVKTRYRRRGVGKRLVTWLEDVARTAGIANIYVQVRKVNRGAITFYTKCGFQVIDQLSGYYRATETGVIMCKSIGKMVGVR
nr:putative integron gene cassette protein [uncultured bacterium]